MGRPKGFILSEEQKARMLEGRKNKKLGIVVEKPIKIESDKKRGGPKGYKRDPETIKKQKETRTVNRNKKLEIVKIDKPLLKISRHWHEGFDFWPAMRNVMRPLHRYDECRKVERLIVNKDIWQNTQEIIKILENYFMIEYRKIKEKSI